MLFCSYNLFAEQITYRWTALSAAKELLKAGNFSGDIEQIGERQFNREFAVLNEQAFRLLAEWNKYGQHYAGTGLYRSESSIDTIKWGYDSPIILIVHDKANSSRNYLSHAWVTSRPTEQVTIRPLIPKPQKIYYLVIVVDEEKDSGV